MTGSRAAHLNTLSQTENACPCGLDVPFKDIRFGGLEGTLVQSFDCLSFPRRDSIEAVGLTDRNFELVLKQLSLIARGVLFFSSHQQPAIDRPFRIARP